METALIILAVVVVVALLAALWWRRERTRRLRTRFGDEYDRTIDDADSRRAGERALRDRVSRRDELHIVPLSAEAAHRYAEEWRGVQERFVDAPAESVNEADVLVMQVMRDRGYPVDDFDRRAEDVSVDHPDVVANYRSGHDIADQSRAGEADTEELRQAVVHYRALFTVLLEDDREDERRHDEGRDDERPTDAEEDFRRAG